MKKGQILVGAVVAAAVLLCTIEALYWPLLPKPGTVLRWWQAKPLAAVGAIVGFPVLVLSKWFGEKLMLAAAVCWSLIIYFVLSFVLARVAANHK